VRAVFQHLRRAGDCPPYRKFSRRFEPIKTAAVGRRENQLVLQTYATLLFLAAIPNFKTIKSFRARKRNNRGVLRCCHKQFQQATQASACRAEVESEGWCVFMNPLELFFKDNTDFSITF